MTVKMICVKYIHGFCADKDAERCEHHLPHAPSLTCNDPRVCCGDNGPSECLPILGEVDWPDD